MNDFLAFFPTIYRSDSLYQIIGTRYFQVKDWIRLYSVTHYSFFGSISYT